MKHSYSNDDTCFSIDVIDEILEEDFDALLDEGSEILDSIEGTILEEKLFAEFDEFMAMTADENSKSESDTEEPPFEKITFNTDYKIKTSLEEPPTDLELKPLPDNLEYVFLEEPSFLPVIISSQLSEENKNKLVSVLKRHKQAFAWKTTNIPGICPYFCKNKIQLMEDKKPVVEKQRRLNPNMQEVVKKEIVKLLDTCIIYPIVDSPWVSPIHCVPKKGGITVVTNERNELVPTRSVTGWRVCIDYRKLNEATVKEHFPFPFMDQMLERLVGNKYFCFLDGFSGYFQIPIDPMDQEKTMFTCPFGTYAYRRMPFGLCNAPATFERCMLAIFHDMNEESVEVFMDDFSIFGSSFDHCLNNLDKMLQRCKDAHLVLNWEKCHFMVKEGIVLGHKVSEAGLEVDKAKIKVISKLPPPLISKVLEAFWDMPILLLQEFDIEIKDRKGTENVAVDHLSRIENDETSDDSAVDDNFPGETLMEINTKDEPWCADFANYLTKHSIAYMMILNSRPQKWIRAAERYRDVKEMKDIFVLVENDLDKTFKQNELLKDQLLEASLAKDVKNLIITSCMEIRNTDLHDETERFSHESKDVSNESKTANTVCNDAFEVTQELSKRIVELEKDLPKFEAKSIAFEIALQHSRK
ncbi:reverse transcriptase domain-containing protein [Tanacetum coccineum]